MAYRVMIVDDDDAMRTTLAETLLRGGHDVVGASNGVEALDTMRGEIPDLVLLDLMMPEMSGWEVLTAMGASPRLAAVPVVVLTAFDDLHDLPSGRPVLHKPMERDLLLDLVRTVLEQERLGGFSLEEPPSDLLPRRRQ
jgi:CheY-like chemotaxis protein